METQTKKINNKDKQKRHTTNKSGTENKQTESDTLDVIDINVSKDDLSVAEDEEQKKGENPR